MDSSGSSIQCMVGEELRSFPSRVGEAAQVTLHTGGQQLLLGPDNLHHGGTGGPGEAGCLVPPT